MILPPQMNQLTSASIQSTLPPSASGPRTIYPPSRDKCFIPDPIPQKNENFRNHFNNGTTSCKNIYQSHSKLNNPQLTQTQMSQTRNPLQEAKFVFNQPSALHLKSIPIISSNPVSQVNNELPLITKIISTDASLKAKLAIQPIIMQRTRSTSSLTNQDQVQLSTLTSPKCDEFPQSCKASVPIKQSFIQNRFRASSSTNLKEHIINQIPVYNDSNNGTEIAKVKVLDQNTPFLENQSVQKVSQIVGLVKSKDKSHQRFFDSKKQTSLAHENHLGEQEEEEVEDLEKDNNPVLNDFLQIKHNAQESQKISLKQYEARQMSVESIDIHEGNIAVISGQIASNTLPAEQSQNSPKSSKSGQLSTIRNGKLDLRTAEMVLDLQQKMMVLLQANSKLSALAQFKSQKCEQLEDSLRETQKEIMKLKEQINFPTKQIPILQLQETVSILLQEKKSREVEFILKLQEQKDNFEQLVSQEREEKEQLRSFFEDNISLKEQAEQNVHILAAENEKLRALLQEILNKQAHEIQVAEDSINCLLKRNSELELALQSTGGIKQFPKDQIPNIEDQLEYLKEEWSRNQEQQKKLENQLLNDQFNEEIIYEKTGDESPQKFQIPPPLSTFDKITMLNY